MHRGTRCSDLRVTLASNPRLLAGLTAVVAGAVLLASSIVPRAELFHGVCLWRTVTGVPCPSCGFTHAFIALGHGRVAEAMQWHLAAPALYVVTWLILLLACVQVITSRDMLSRVWRRCRYAAVALCVFGLSVNWMMYAYGL